MSLPTGEPPKGFKEVTKKVYETFVDSVSKARQDAISKKMAVKNEKIKGFLFDGIECSVTRKDQDGLTAVFVGINAGFLEESKFIFSNGSELTITKENIAEFAALWTQKRQSFFK